LNQEVPYANAEFYGLCVSCRPSVEPFLYIGVIVSTRRILTTGAQVSYLGELTDLIFNCYLMDRWANMLVVASLDHSAKVCQFSLEGDLTW